MKLSKFEIQNSSLFAGIGSRSIDQKGIDLIREACVILGNLGYTCVSGNSDGADIQFQRWMNHIAILPWARFNYENYIPKNLYVLSKDDVVAEAEAKKHTNWKYLKQGTRKLFTRNYRQLVGATRNVEFVLYWSSIPISSGTSYTVALAKRLKIPTANLYTYMSAREALMSLDGTSIADTLTRRY